MDRITGVGEIIGDQITERERNGYEHPNLITKQE
jgi:hypothetical protein